ncbi:MAG: hypothetical protein QXG15_04125 [Desulfurococcaceae archaeon]
MSTVKTIKVDRGWLRMQLAVSVVYFIISIVMVIASAYTITQGFPIQGSIYMISYIITLIVSMAMMVKIQGLLRTRSTHLIEGREEQFLILQQGGWLIFALGFSIILLIQSPAFEISVAFMALNVIASVLFLVISIVSVVGNKVKYNIRISP